MAIADRAVSKANVNLAKKALREQPRITITQFAKVNGMARATASAAINRARQEMARIETKAEIKASELQEKQHKEALRVLQSQISRLESLPAILVALRKKTFTFSRDGEITGIKKMVKGYNKEGEEILLTPASIVNEYLSAEKAIIEQERLVTGIAAREKAATAAAGKTDITLQLPISPADILLK